LRSSKLTLVCVTVTVLEGTVVVVVKVLVEVIVPAVTLLVL
jgi:hypothetical protein